MTSGRYAIKATDVAKRYRIGEAKRYSTLRDALAEALTRPFARTRGQPRAEAVHWALDGVTFEVEEGEVVGIIGRNGAGKSTLLKLVSRIVTPTRGEIRTRGKVGALLEVGTGFHLELTGRENIYLNGAILGMARREIRRKLDEIVAFAGTEEFLETPVKRYSTGMYLRLAFAVAAHLEPDILLVDEVLAVGDLEFQRKCLAKMNEVSRAGRTVLFVSHNLAAIERLCDRAICITKGRISAEGAPSGVITQYLKQTTASDLRWTRTGESTPPTGFEEICITDERGNPTGVATTGGSLHVSLRFVVFEPYPDLQITVVLSDEYGNPILWSVPQDASINPPVTPGVYRARLVFPDGLLLPRRYGLRASLWRPPNQTLDLVEALEFSVTETASLGNSNPTGRGGVVAVRCAWAIDRYESSDKPAGQQSSD